MSSDGIELINKHSKLLDAIRLNKGLDKSGIALELGMTWPTISAYIKELMAEDVLCRDDRSESKADSNILRFNNNYGIFLGISVGSAQIKVCAVNMEFQMLSNEEFHNLITIDGISSFGEQDGFKQPSNPDNENYVWAKTPRERQDLIQTINNVFAAIKHIVEKNVRYRVLGIGVAITGAIDQKQKRIIKSFNLCNMDETDFEEDILLRNYLDFFEMKGINIAIENNAMAAGIAEKWSFYNEKNLNGEFNINQKYKDCRNIATIYLGAGFGLGMIQDNKVYRGSNNLCGGIAHLEIPNYSEREEKNVDDVECIHSEIGSLEVPIDSQNEAKIDSECTCGGKNCLDYRVRTDVFETTFDAFKDMDSKKIKEFFQKKENKEKKKDILMGQYLGYIINLLNNLLNPDVIVISGKLYKAIDELWGAVQLKKSENNLKYTNSNCAIIKSQLGPLAPTIGAAICAYYDKYGANIEW